MKKLLSLLLVTVMLLGTAYIPVTSAYAGFEGESSRMFYGSQLNDYEGIIYDAMMNEGEDFSKTSKSEDALKIEIPEESRISFNVPASDFTTSDIKDRAKEVQSMDIFKTEYQKALNLADKALNAFVLDSLNTTWARSYNRSYGFSLNSIKENVTEYVKVSFTTCNVYLSAVYYSGALDDIDDVNAALLQMEQDIRDEYGISESSSAYQKVRAVSDYVGQRVDYYQGDLSDNEVLNLNGQIFTVAGAALSKFSDDGKYYVVCEGYCKTVRYLLDRFGVESFIVRGGQERDDSGNVKVNHMWLYIKMDDGKWYGSDPTWDDKTDSYMKSVLTDYLLAGKNTVPTHFNNPAFGEDHLPSEKILSSEYASSEYVKFTYPELSDDYYVRMTFNDDGTDISVDDVFETYPDVTFDLEQMLTIESPYSKSSLTFSSSNTDILSINGKYATAVAGGTATVTATFNKKYTADLTVGVIGDLERIIPDKETYITNLSTSAQILFTTYPPDRASSTDINWVSSDVTKATVSETGLVTPISTGNVTITGTAKENSSISFSVTVKIVSPITNIEITDNPAPTPSSRETIIKGDTKTLIAVANPAGCTEEYVWESSDTSVASVNNGTITAVGGGDAVITVRSESGAVSDSYYLHVRVPLEKVTLSYPIKDILLTGKTVDPIMSFVPADTNDSRNIRYKSSNPSVCTADEATGAITGIAPGKAVISLMTDYDDISAQYNVTVKQPVPGFTLYNKADGETVNALRINKNDEVSLGYKILEEEISYWGNLSWSSKNPSIASVSDDGTVTALSAGETRIGIVSDIGVEAYIDVKVVVPLESFTAEPVKAHIAVGESTGISFLFEPSDTTDPDEYGISAVIEDTDIVNIEDGKIVGLKSGVTKITVSVGDVETDFNIHVYQVPSIKLKSKNSDGITLEWSPISCVDSYIIERSTDGKNYTEIAEVPSDDFNGVYTDTSILPNTKYYYRCAAVKNFEDEVFTTPYSNVINAAVSIGTPKISSVKALNSSQISITWSKVAEATGYTLYYSLDEINYKILAKVNADTLTYTHSGVDFAYLYYYKVTANIGDFSSNYSNAVRGRANIPTPKITAVSSVTYTSSKVQWTPVKGVTGYYLYRSTDNKSWKKTAVITGANTSSYADKNLTCGTTYYYTLRAYVKVGTESFQSGYNNGVGVKIIPATPKITAVKWKNCTTAQITWGKVAGADKYVLYRSAKSANGSWTKVAIVTSLSYTDKNLTCGADYYYTVKAYNNAGKSYSKYNAGTKITMVPAKPSVSSAVCKSYNSIKITWNKINEASGYYIYRTTKTDGTGFEKLKRLTGSGSVTYTDSKAQCGVKYYYTVRAFKVYNRKDVLSSYNKPGTACTAVLVTPKIQGAVSVNYNSVRLNWAKTAGAEGYIIYRSTAQNSGWVQIGTVKNGSSVTYTDKTAVCGKQYYYTMRSYRTVNGKAVKSGYVKTGIAGKAVPNTPAISKAKIVNAKKVALTWNKIDGANGYVIYRSTKASGGWQAIATITSGTSVVYNDTGINNATKIKYYYTIRAYRVESGKRVYSAYKTVGTATSK